MGKTFIDGFYFLWESVILSAMPSLLKWNSFISLFIKNL